MLLKSEHARVLVINYRRNWICEISMHSIQRIGHNFIASIPGLRLCVKCQTVVRHSYQLYLGFRRVSKKDSVVLCK